MSTVHQLQQEEEELEARLSEVRDAINRLTGPKLGKLPNSRAGFYHIHSASYECGMAYWENADDYDYPNKGEYKKCSKLVNHPGLCGYEDNTAF